ncbi:MAG: hypothetical protein R3A45_04350 [Bdellovibrionota bacterium]
MSVLNSSVDIQGYSSGWLLESGNDSMKVDLPFNIKRDKNFSDRKEFTLTKKFKNVDFDKYQSPGIVFGRIGDTADIFVNSCKVIQENSDAPDGWLWGGLRYSFLDKGCIIDQSEFTIKYQIRHWGFAHKGVFDGPFGFANYKKVKKLIQVVEFLRFDLFLFLEFC